MTEIVLRALSRSPQRLLARPASAFALALVLAYAGGLWMTLLHHAEGGTERGEPALVVHWLRDATLSLPLVFCAVWLGVVVARRLLERLERRGATASEGLATFVTAACVAVATADVMGLATPLHTALFDATHGGPELSPALHVVRDTLLALAVDLPVAGLACLVLRRERPWATPPAAAWRMPSSPARRLAFNAALGLLVIAPVALVVQNGAELAAAGAGPGAPCPTGAPAKTFDVKAIDVDIPLNRFGDHDPNGKMYVLADKVGAVREQESSRKVSLGLGDDPIQPLVIRANQGDCVQINFANDASGGEYGVHIDGLSYDVSSSGDAVGDNDSSSVSGGESRSYRFYIPDEPEFEGSHYLRPGPGNRRAASHGLFGSLVVEPKGSTYHHPTTGRPITSGWEAWIRPGSGKAFREGVKLFHEIGDETTDVFDKDGDKLPRVDPVTTAYRPATRAVNYRSEPFMRRLERDPQHRWKSLAYNSYTFGDPATPMMRGYLGDPTKIRVLHAGTETFHVYHLHGGGIRWRFNPHADKTFDYADTGLNKRPKAQGSPSSRLDSQSTGPGESYDLQIEGGAGGVQQSAGDFLYHCHIAEHYVAGMWSFWRVFDTRQPDLMPLPDRAAPPSSVTSDGLIGRTMPDGTTLTKDNLDAWVKPQLPPQGTPRDDEDASVWDYRIDRSNPGGPVFLGEPEDRSGFEDMRDGEHPGAMPGDTFVGDRPTIRFNPVNGRPAFPLLRPHFNTRAPFSPQGHAGAPWLGERGDAAKSKDGPDPAAGRPDGICPAGSQVRRFNLVSLELPIRVTQKGATDPNGKIFTLAEDADDVMAGRKAPEPLAIRGNIGDCIRLTLTSRQKDTAESPFSMTNVHIHHVQFDVQASDGVGTGMQFGQAVRPYALEDPRLTAAVDAGLRTVPLSDVAKFHVGASIAVGEGTENIEIRDIEAIDAAAGTVTLDKPLEHAHPEGEHAGTEFVQYTWYPDVELDNVFWHDHVDGIHNWGHGLVGQFIVEPRGSTYHDPRTGEQVDSGTYVDVRTPNALAPGSVSGAFRELALWEINENPATDSTINLRAAPFADRGADDPSLLFSSYRWGDPNTPLPQAYAGDPFVIRSVSVSPTVDSLKLDGHRFSLEPRHVGTDGRPEGAAVDSTLGGVSEKYTAILQGGAGGTQQRPGDYLYFNGVGRRFRQGAWGILRVLPKQVDGLQPLPGTDVPTGGGPLPEVTGDRPPAAGGAGSPCPSGAATRTFEVSAVDVPNGADGAKAVYVPTADAEAVRTGAKQPEPLVLHAAAGECVEVLFANERRSPGAGKPAPRASFHVAKLDRTAASSGVNVGFNPEATVAAGERRTYRFYADTVKLGSATITDFGDQQAGRDGLYGAMVIAPSGATFADPESGLPRDVGSQVDVHVPGGRSYRDFSLLLADSDPIIGGNFMPYPTGVGGPALVNYRSAPRADGPAMFSSRANGDPATPVLRAYAGDPTKVHVISTPDSEQPHAFSLGGLSWRQDEFVDASLQLQTRGIAPAQTMDIDVTGGAGGLNRSVGDHWYGDLRRPFAEGGMWGLMRVLSDRSCPIRPLPGLGCTAQAPVHDLGRPAPAPDAAPPAGGGGEVAVTPAPAPAPSPAPRPAAKAPAPQAAVSGLVFGSRQRPSVLRRRGLRFRATVRGDARTLHLRLFRVSGSGRRATATPVASSWVKIKRGGRLTVTWRLSAATVKRLKAGRYALSVAAGPSGVSKRLFGGAADRSLTVLSR